MRRLGPVIGLVVTLALGFSAVAWLTRYIEQQRPALPEEYTDSDLTLNGARLRGFLLGMDGLVADWYYIRAVQYVGDKIINSKSEMINIEDLRDLNPRLLYPLLQNATDLDPHFTEAYMYGAIVLPAIDPKQAVAIGEKGVLNNPGEWRLYRPLGYIYWRLGLYEKASETYEKGSQIPGSPPFLKLMSAVMKTKGGSRDTARQIYREMLDSSADDQVRLTAERRLAQLDSLDERDAIDGVLAEFQRETGRCPSGFAEIIPRLANVTLPDGRHLRVDRLRNVVDPTDAPYLLDQQNCKATLDAGRSGIASQ